MQKLDLPQAVEDLAAKIELLKERLQVIAEGIILYEELQLEEADTVKAWQHRERWIKLREEEVIYTEQLKSQQVYITEFQNDLKKQAAIRKQQLQQMKEHLPNMLNAAKDQLRKNKNLMEQDRTLISSLREQFVKKQFDNDDQKISRFKELVQTLQRVTKIK